MGSTDVSLGLLLEKVKHGPLSERTFRSKDLVKELLESVLLQSDAAGVQGLASNVVLETQVHGSRDVAGVASVVSEASRTSEVEIV